VGEVREGRRDGKKERRTEGKKGEVDILPI